MIWALSLDKTFTVCLVGWAERLTGEVCISALFSVAPPLSSTAISSSLNYPSHYCCTEEQWLLGKSRTRFLIYFQGFVLSQGQRDSGIDSVWIAQCRWDVVIIKLWDNFFSNKLWSLIEWGGADTGTRSRD